jgi:hypothetical protein
MNYGQFFSVLHRCDAACACSQGITVSFLFQQFCSNLKLLRKYQLSVRKIGRFFFKNFDNFHQILIENGKISPKSKFKTI